MKRIGLAGAGFVAPHHLKAWQRLRGRAEVVAIADPNVEAAHTRAREFGLRSVYSSVEEMFEQEHLDVVDVATSRETHAPICRLAADRGLAIICQKPLAPTFDEAVSLVTALSGRVRLMVHENWRFRPHYRRIAGWLRDGRIGKVRTATMALLTSGLIPDSSGRAPAIERQPMFATLERTVVTLHRERFGPLQLGDLEVGAVRPRGPVECRALHALQVQQR